jgi:hypothetical protein
MSQNERDADDFDAKLFGLMERANYLSEKPGWRNEWGAVRDHLNRARGLVRNMMDLKRRAETAG